MTASTTSTPPLLHQHTAPESDRITKKSPKQGDSRANRLAKAWTSDDERVLLQGRLERVPYKQIGAKLGKTDLACRLHFHQMVMAKRTPSTQPGRSIVFLSSEHPPEIHRLAPPTATPASRNWSCVPPLINEPFNTSSSLLRPPQDPFLHRRSVSDPFGSSMPLPTLPQWRPASSPYLSPYTSYNNRDASSVDLDKLQNIYKEHASDFWSNIAAKYSGIAQLTPSELEQAFFNARPTDEGYFDLPPIGNVSSSRSDASCMSREQSPGLVHNYQHTRSSSVSTPGRCSVDSLLNHGRY